MAIYERSSWFLSAVAIGLLLLGSLGYLIFRGGSSVYFLVGIFSEAASYPVSAGYIFNSFPSFLHIYIFILFTAIVLKPSRIGLIFICLGWMGIELFFEIGQHPFFAQHLTKWVPAWFADFPYLEVANTYFISGRFDPVDVLFTFFGAAAALFTLHKVQRWEVDHV